MKKTKKDLLFDEKAVYLLSDEESYLRLKEIIEEEDLNVVKYTSPWELAYECECAFVYGYEKESNNELIEITEKEIEDFAEDMLNSTYDNILTAIHNELEENKGE